MSKLLLAYVGGKDLRDCALSFIGERKMLTYLRLPVALVAVLAIGACASGIAWSHPGGLAQDGCHRVADTDTRQGGN